MSFIIVTGNPISGHNFYGPFDTADSATGYMDHVLTDCEGEDWWVAPLVTPEASLPRHPIPPQSYNAADQPVPYTDNMAERLNWLHCNVQELQQRGVEMPMGDYDDVYSIIEDAREVMDQ
jgi:hypothetical protein